MRRKCFSVSSQAEATQRSTMEESRQRLTLWVRRRTPLWGLSMRLVVARHLWSDAGICSRCKVNMSLIGSVATFDWRSMGSQELGGETVDARAQAVNSK